MIFKEKPTDDKKRLLVSLIPTIDCVSGCQICCYGPWSFGVKCRGMVPDEQYAIEIGEYFKMGSDKCNRLDETKCSIFNNRPLICWIFWKMEGDPSCPSGLKPKRYLTKEELRRLCWCWYRGTYQDAKALQAEMGEYDIELEGRLIFGDTSRTD